MKRFVAPIAIGTASLLGVLSLTWLFWPQRVALEVTRIHWHREVVIEQLNTVIERGTYLPNGSRLRKSWIEIHMEVSTNADGEMETTPEFETHYEYDIERWQRVGLPLETAGEGHQTQWPVYSLAAGTGPYNVGAQRDHRYETYFVELEGDGAKHTTRLAYDQWRRIELQQPVYATMFRWGSVLAIQELETP